MAVCFQETDGGYLLLGRSGVRVHMPIIKKDILNKPEGFEPDVMAACVRYVPELSGITERFRREFSAFQHADTARMLALIDYAASHMMYGLYKPDNPGHLFVLIQCLGGWWGGVAAQVYAKVLLEACDDLKGKSKNAASGMEFDLLIAVLGCVCKSFGCSARMPLVPHYPGGSPPDVVVLLADAILARHPSLRGQRDEVITALRDWHIPRYMRESLSVDARRIWLPQNQIDRTTAFLERNVILKQI